MSGRDFREDYKTPVEVDPTIPKSCPQLYLSQPRSPNASAGWRPEASAFGLSWKQQKNKNHMLGKDKRWENRYEKKDAREKGKE